jgi:carboxylesterase
VLWIALGIVAVVVAFYAYDAWNAVRIASAISEYEASQPKDTHGVILGKEGYRKMAGKTACLLIHGFRGSPEVFQELAQVLVDEGISVDAMLLPGHARGIEDLAATRWANWTAAVESAYLHLKEQHQQAFVIGFSLGALLAAHLATRHSPTGVIAISPLIRVNPKRYGDVSLRVRLWLAKGFFFTRVLELHRPSDIHDPVVKEACRSHPFYPIGTSQSILELTQMTMKEVRRIKCPLLVLQSRHDQVVDPSASEAFYNAAASADKELQWFENSGHELLLDQEKQQVFANVLEFLRKRSN